MNDDTGNGFSWSAPSYSLGGPDTSPGIKTGDLGNYQLGSGLGSVGEGAAPSGPSFGESQMSAEQQAQLLNNLYQNPTFSLNSLYGTIDSPLLGETEKTNWQNIGTLQEDLSKVPMPAFDSKKYQSRYLSSLAEDARQHGVPFSQVLGREPTFEELKTLSSSGYGTMEGVNPNNLKGQNVDNMIAAQRTGTALGMVGNALIGAAMPAPISMALNGYKAYQGFQKTGDWKSALAKVVGGVGGYVGAAGQALQGNYGNAVTSALSKGGASPLASLVAGTGVDYSQGKNVTQNLGGIAGYTLGTAAGRGYGGLGQSLGRSLSSLYRK